MTFKHLNSLGQKREPFLFISDFKAKNLKVYRLSELQNEDIEFCINEDYTLNPHAKSFENTPVSFKEYKTKFEAVIERIKSGDTYLLNLTQQTKIDSNLTLQEIFFTANAHYKLRFKDEFVCFSPETLVPIDNNKIHTYPMKGTIDASIPHAAEQILNNKKEMAEHIMVVDLLRNDLSIVASDVKVEQFRYITKIDSGSKSLLQVSSHISGELQENWHEKIGDILQALLPAGSISGTPKKSTLAIIDEVEGYERGFFSGVFGVYDGESFDSGVMIRFVEKTDAGYVYKSGGGITLDSDAESEYQEMIDKVYFP